MYWKLTGDATVFTPDVKAAYEKALTLMELERYRHAHPQTRRERLYGWAQHEMPDSYADPATSRS